MPQTAQDLEPDPTQTVTLPPTPIGVVETDTFCEKCGFNLHTQAVWRDPRLGILICRCPECGDHQPAGQKTSIGFVWLNRLGTFALTLWVLFVILFVTAAFFGFFGTQIAATEALTVRQWETQDGRPLENTYDQQTAKPKWVLQDDPNVEIPQNQIVYAKRLAPWLPGATGARAGRVYYLDILGLLICCALIAIGILLVSALLASISWHWRPGRMYFWLLLPVLSSVVAFTIVATEDANRARTMAFNQYDVVHVSVWVSYTLVAVALGLEMLVMALCLRMGRPVARFVLSILVPPKARQVFACLWTCDGKIPPSAKPLAS